MKFEELEKLIRERNALNIEHKRLKELFNSMGQQAGDVAQKIAVLNLQIAKGVEELAVEEKK